MTDRILQALERSGVVLTQKGKHSTKGWVQMECPFCVGSPGYHLGYNLSGRYFHCWRCGWKPVALVLKTMTSLPADVIWSIFKESRTRSGKNAVIYDRTKPPHAPVIELPKEAVPGLLPRAKRYLARRGFLPTKLERLWGLYTVGPFGRYKHRIIIPVTMEGRLVSFQARDYTGKAPAKYLAPPGNDIKKTVYGWDRIADGCAIIVEGVTDVWRLGPGAVAVFGTGWKAEQRNLLSTLRKVLIAFDPEPDAQKRAEKLGHELAMAGVGVRILEGLPTDPGDLKPDEVEEVRRVFLELKTGKSFTFSESFSE